VKKKVDSNSKKVSICYVKVIFFQLDLAGILKHEKKKIQIREIK